jgi:hypothetical protein
MPSVQKSRRKEVEQYRDGVDPWITFRDQDSDEPVYPIASKEIQQKGQERGNGIDIEMKNLDEPVECVQGIIVD